MRQEQSALIFDTFYQEKVQLKNWNSDRKKDLGRQTLVKIARTSQLVALTEMMKSWIPDYFDKLSTGWSGMISIFYRHYTGSRKENPNGGVKKNLCGWGGDEIF